MIDTAQNLKDYKKRLKKALDNKFLRAAMGTFATAYKEAQGRIFQGVDVEGLRREIARGKAEALPRLEELYQAFKAKAEAAGVKVHLAATATEANQIIAGIARGHGVKKIVKSKSMTAEETFLNDHLEAEGLEVVETDLGEWIIQLRHEGPSHMVMPAIHLSRQEVADLFTKVTGEPQEPDIGNLVKVARRELRKAFLTADMGISGANFAIAATGTLGIISNEGNARLTTTLPRVHVALVGVDKLVPDLHAALRILKILPRPGHRPDYYFVRLLDHRGQRVPHRARRQQGNARRLSGQRPPGPGPGPGVFRGPALHPLRLLRQCLPHLQPGGRPQLRPRLYRRHRPHPHLFLPRPQK